MFEQSTTHFTFAAALVAGVIGFSVGVSAAPLQVETVSYLDDESGYVADGWQVEGRIGGRSTWEVAIGANTQSNSGMQNTHVTWQNGVSEAFTLDWDGADAVFSIAGRSVQVTNVDSDFNAIRIRAKVNGADNNKLGLGTSVTVSDLMLNDVVPAIDNVGLTSTDSYQDQRLYLYLANPFNPFVLSGNMTFAWDPNGINPFAQNASSRVQFFIDVGDRSFAFQGGGNDESASVSTPAALALLLAGVAALPTVRRKAR